MRVGTWAAVVIAAAAVSCAAAPERTERRTLVDAWREAGRALPAGTARARYLELAATATTQAAALREAESDAFDAVARLAERHNVSRAELYGPLAKLQATRRTQLLGYARTRLAMRTALSEAEWTTVVKAVRP